MGGGSFCAYESINQNVNSVSQKIIASLAIKYFLKKKEKQNKATFHFT